MNFIDGDLLIQEQEHKLLREIIAEEGQEGFLKIENRINASLQAGEFRDLSGRKRDILRRGYAAL